MKHDHFIVQSPATPAQQLLLLFHGVGDNPVAMGQIGRDRKSTRLNSVTDQSRMPSSA